MVRAWRPDSFGYEPGSDFRGGDCVTGIHLGHLVPASRLTRADADEGVLWTVSTKRDSGGISGDNVDRDLPEEDVFEFDDFSVAEEELPGTNHGETFV